MTPPVTLRPTRADDTEFLYRVYASTREQELAVLDWSGEQKEAFLRMQFDAQHTFYHQHFPECAYQVIEAGDEPIGRLYLDRRDDEFRIIDIALLSEHRNAGIGGRLMRDILDEAAASGKPVRIHVERFNPALSLYQRLGFEQIEDQGVYLLLEWTPDNSNKSEEKTKGQTS